MIGRVKLLLAVASSSVFQATVLASQERLEPAHRVETGKFVLEWRDAPGAEEITAVRAEVQKFYIRVAAMLGVDPGRKVTVVLGGNAQRPDGTWEYPRISMGRVLLFKYVPDFTNYYSALAHELVHAFRVGRAASVDWFFEEGFAEFVALRVDSSLAGFPWFDFPVTLVAGQWLANGEAIPLTVLNERHRELNLKCGAQSYALRSSFFDWLGRTVGDSVLIEAANSRSALRPGDYEEFFGRPFEELASAWRTELLAAYRAIPDVQAVAVRYRRKSPIQYQHVCSSPADF